LLTIKRKQKAVDMVVGFKGFNRTQQQELDILGMMNTILGEGSNSRLFKHVRDELGLSYYIGSGHTDYTDDGVLYVGAGVMPDKAETALIAILRECQKLTQELVTEKELQTAKEYLKGHMLLDLETSDDVLQFFAFQQLLEPQLRTPEQLLERIDRITIEDIQHIAQQIFVPGNVYLGTIGTTPAGFTKKAEKIINEAFT
jgi:predicted Zn-dependent peptidase